VVQRRLLMKLVPASVLMIALGLPGEISLDVSTRLLWGTLSTIPFLYILYVLFVEVMRSLDRQPPGVPSTLKKLLLLLIATWGVYPIAYLFPVLGFDGADAFVLKQAGYTIADILAKAAFGLVIFKIAKMKSQFDDPNFLELGEQYNQAPGTTPGHDEVDDAVRGGGKRGASVRV
jgi:bacteriorhodopsin